MNLDQHWDGNVSHKRFINLPGFGDYLPIVVGMYLTRAWHHLILQDGKTKTCLSYIIYVLFILNPCLSIYHEIKHEKIENQLDLWTRPSFHLPRSPQRPHLFPEPGSPAADAKRSRRLDADCPNRCSGHLSALQRHDLHLQRVEP